jgi:outer membrane protein
VFDKAGGSSMIYANPRFDLSDEVLQKIGNVMTPK